MDGGKILTNIVEAIIEPKTLSTYTWSGKNNKLKFKINDKILKLIYELAYAADKKYTKAAFDSDMVKKVFKNAYKKSDEFIKKQANKPNAAKNIIPSMESTSSIVYSTQTFARASQLVSGNLARINSRSTMPHFDEDRFYTNLNAFDFSSIANNQFSK